MTIRTLAADDIAGYNEIYGPPNSGSVKDVEGDGSTSPIGPELKLVTSNQPASLALLASYPNPFNPETTIQFELSEPSEVSLRIYNVTGQLVDELVSSKFYVAGRHTVVWKPGEGDKQQSSGVYIVQLRTGIRTISRKITLLH